MYVCLKGGGYNLNRENIIEGAFLGIVVILVMHLSRLIKKTWLFIPVAICVMVLMVLIKKLIFQGNLCT
jgi:ribose 5-phosphate isomerase